MGRIHALEDAKQETNRKMNLGRNVRACLHTCDQDMMNLSHFPWTTVSRRHTSFDVRENEAVRGRSIQSVKCKTNVYTEHACLADQVQKCVLFNIYSEDKKNWETWLRKLDMTSPRGNLWTWQHYQISQIFIKQGCNPILILMSNSNELSTEFCSASKCVPGYDLGPWMDCTSISHTLIIICE